MRHPFHFEGGEILTTMGATWFVSYSWYEKKDKTHTNWRKLSTYKNRESVFRNSRNYHQKWLHYVTSMSDANLNKNTLGLDAKEIKKMAAELLKTM
ncbi:MAG: hypothetical protein IKA80_08710 [Spirochaetaceae bacterium]|nr:hypothetical protein [Spirochaetaceae bacterium]